MGSSWSRHSQYRGITIYGSTRFCVENAQGHEEPHFHHFNVCVCIFLVNIFLKSYPSAFQIVEEYFLERTEAVLPGLYLLKRGLSSLHSAEQSALYFNAPDLSGQSAFIHGTKLELSAIKDLHLRSLDEITLEIDQLTFHLPQFRLSQDETIHDEPRECKPNYSFISDQRNSWNHRPSLLQHILQSEDLFQKYAYITPDKRVSWVPTLIAPVVEQIYVLQKKLLCLIILSYGEPARGTELASHLLANVPGGSIRNFFVLFNLPVLRGSFNKTSHQGTDRAICRFPFPELGEQFVRFLVYVRPLFLEWQTYLRPEMSHNARHYLFAGLHRPIKSHDISSAMADFTIKELNVRLTLRTYRQYMAFITSSNHRVFAAVADTDAGTYEQFGHSEDINTKHYGQDSRTPDGTNIKTFLAHARVSAAFHILYGHHPTLLERLESNKAHTDQLIATIMKIRHPLQSSTPTATAPHALSTTDPHLIAKIQNVFEQSLVKSYSAVVDLFTAPTTVHQLSTSFPAAPVVTHPYILKKLRQLYPDLPTNAAFKNVPQAQIAQLLFEGNRHVAYISPTGE